MSDSVPPEDGPEIERLRQQKLQLEIEQLRDRAPVENEKLSLELAKMKGLGSWIPSLIATTASLVTAASIVYAAISGTQYIAQQKEILEIERKKLEYREEDLNAIESAWGEASRSAVNEPSGLAATGISTATGAHLALAVDDDVDSLFLLRSSGEHETLVWKVLRLEPRPLAVGSDAGVNDLESLCFDGAEFHAFSSHRRVGRPNVMRALHFSLRSSNDRNIEGTVNFEPDGLDPKRVATALTNSGAVQSSMNSEGDIIIDGRDWTEDDHELYHYALQVEGAACDSNRIWLGLRNPVAADGPILLVYRNDGALGDQDPDTLILDTSEVLPEGEAVHYGISSLDYLAEEQRLFVALNPPQLREYGASIIAAYELSDDKFRFVGSEKVARDDAKLEGLAVVGPELWLTYDGAQPYYERRDLKEFSALLGR